MVGFVWIGLELELEVVEVVVVVSIAMVLMILRLSLFIPMAKTVCMRMNIAKFIVSIWKMRKNGKNYYLKEINNNKIKFNSEEMISARHTSENSLILLQIMKTNFFHLRNGMKIYTYKHFSAYFSSSSLFLAYIFLFFQFSHFHCSDTIYTSYNHPQTPHILFIFICIYIYHTSYFVTHSITKDIGFSIGELFKCLKQRSVDEIYLWFFYRGKYFRNLINAVGVFVDDGDGGVGGDGSGGDSVSVVGAGTKSERLSRIARL